MPGLVMSLILRLNKSMKHLPILLIAATLGFGGCSKPAEETVETPAPPAKVIIALKPDKDPENMLAERQRLQTVLSEKLGGRPVEVIVPLSSAVILEGMANGTIDLGYLSATDLLNARDQKIGSALLAGEINGQTSYASYWVALKDKPYTKVADLQGKPIAFASKTSTSGYLIPHADLVRQELIPAGADPATFFGEGNVFYGTGYVSAVEKVLNGEAEAAAVSYYVLDRDKHLTAEQRAQLKKVTEQGPVPTHVIAVSDRISAADQAQFRTALLALNADQMELRDRVFTSKLVEVDTDAHLAPLREVMKLTGKSQ